MKRILFITSGFGSGGAEHQCSQLINMLVDRGYSVTIASFYDVPDHYFISPKVVRIKLAPLQSSKKKIWAVEKYLLTTKSDVVVAFSQRLSCLTLLPLLFRPKIKVISSERNFTIGEPDQFEKILTKTGLYRRANYIVSNNYSQGRYLAEKMPSVKEKIRIITNYTDINTYLSSPVPNNNIVRIGIFCRFEIQKNFHKLLEALYVLNQRFHYAYHIDWYGNHKFSSDAQRQYFEDGMLKIKEFRLEKYITIHEPTKEVDKLIPIYDVMCLPSLHEGFSNSISEYICCGRPVICSDVSDNSVMVHDGYNGFLFNPLDVEDIVKSFVKYFETTKEQRTQMGINSRKIAENLFDKERFIESYIELIEA
ncbi:MAG: glycosyltransferase family 4 protein [Paludibacteraceae bacterium]|nr:glycosyltransferase family 4 protein [Paludibacteraceae bacterium]